MNMFDHKDPGNHLLQLYPKVVKHPVYIWNQNCNDTGPIPFIECAHVFSK